MRWLEHFKPCFGHRVQLVSLRTYVQGLFNDSDRKSMQAMLARVTDPVTYQAFQYFMTHAPWKADAVWRRLLAVLPERRGACILDSTGIPKQGPHSVGVARQYCGALGKIANCQVAVTAALWTVRRARPGAWGRVRLAARQAGLPTPLDRRGRAACGWLSPCPGLAVSS